MIVVAEGNRVDWPRVLLDLKAAGFSYDALAEKLQIPRTTLVGYRDLDAEPPFSSATRIVALWCEAKGTWSDALPVKKDLR